MYLGIYPTKDHQIPILYPSFLNPLRMDGSPSRLACLYVYRAKPVDTDPEEQSGMPERYTRRKRRDVDGA